TSRPAIMRSTVLFPPPLGPSSAVISPLGISKETWSTTFTAPNDLQRSRTTMPIATSSGVPPEQGSQERGPPERGPSERESPERGPPKRRPQEQGSPERGPPKRGPEARSGWAQGAAVGATSCAGRPPAC